MQASLLDRLIDQDPDNPREPVQYRQITYNQAKNAVGRDLENLLNTKCFTHVVPDSCRELGRSLYIYGLSDFTAKNPASPSVRTELRQQIEKAIQLFEPRLQKVTVRVDDADSKERKVRFKIVALLVMDNESEPVSFDTIFDINRGEYTVPK
jgi:type VI secretion system protein ImpF